MRYAINFDKTINQLVPYYLGGRRLILLLQACMKPLQKINDDFVTYAKEQRIEASMTSQIFKFEWFLNRKFKKYFEDPSAMITIKNGEITGKAIYFENAKDVLDSEHVKLWTEDEISDSDSQAVFYYENDQTIGSSCSFLVCVPKLDEIKDGNGNGVGQLKDGTSISQFKSLLSHWIDKYRLSGKTYKIIINN